MFPARGVRRMIAAGLMLLTAWLAPCPPVLAWADEPVEKPAEEKAKPPGRGLAPFFQNLMRGMFAPADRQGPRVRAGEGTTAERAQETLDVSLQVIRELTNGIDPAELDRCRTRAKSSLIMQQESTMSRASSIASDWFHLGRVTTLAEVRDRIESLTVETVLDYVRRKPAGDFTILTLGPKRLEMPA